MSALEQGDIIELDCGLLGGHEPERRSPAVVITDFAFNARSPLVGVVPVRSTGDGYPLHVPVKAGAVHGFACVEMARNVDVGRRGCRRIGSADDGTMRTIMGCVRGMYGLR